jgi:hypothetical protein
MRIQRSKFYLIAKRSYDCWGDAKPKKNLFIITGMLAQGSERINVIEEAYIKPQLRYRLEDGHLPEFCPLVLGREAKEFLTNNPYSRIEEME